MTHEVATEQAQISIETGFPTNFAYGPIAPLNSECQPVFPYLRADQQKSPGPEYELLTIADLFRLPDYLPITAEEVADILNRTAARLGGFLLSWKPDVILRFFDEGNLTLHIPFLEKSLSSVTEVGEKQGPDFNNARNTKWASLANATTRILTRTAQRWSPNLQTFNNSITDEILRTIAPVTTNQVAKTFELSLSLLSPLKQRKPLFKPRVQKHRKIALTGVVSPIKEERKSVVENCFEVATIELRSPLIRDDEGELTLLYYPTRDVLFKQNPARPTMPSQYFIVIFDNGNGRYLLQRINPVDDIYSAPPLVT